MQLKSEVSLDLKRNLNSILATIFCILMLFFSIVSTYYYGYTKRGKIQNSKIERRRVTRPDF